MGTATDLATVVLDLLAVETAAGERLAIAMADLGAALLREFEKRGKKGFAAWIRSLRAAALKRGLTPLTAGTARQRIRVERFRRATKERFPSLITLKVSKLYPIVSLGDQELSFLVAAGGLRKDGTRVAIGEATARDIKRAAAAIRAINGTSGVRARTPADPFEQLMKLVDAIGPMTNVQIERLTAATGLVVPKAESVNRQEVKNVPENDAEVPPLPVNAPEVAAPVPVILTNIGPIAPAIPRNVPENPRNVPAAKGTRGAPAAGAA